MITIKIGRHEYDITSDDKFLDNGACVQLTTQNKERGTWGHHPDPVLSKRAIKEISAFKRIPRKNTYMSEVDVFSIDV